MSRLVSSSPDRREHGSAFLVLETPPQYAGSWGGLDEHCTGATEVNSGIAPLVGSPGLGLRCHCNECHSLIGGVFDSLIGGVFDG
jgi:hypothetical protein